MIVPEAHIVTEQILEQAERQRVVAHSIADLHFVHTALELHVESLTSNPDQQVDPYDIRLAAPRFTLWPRFIDGESGVPKYNGFCVDESVPFGGARNLLVYDTSTTDPLIQLHYQEFHPLTTTVDYDGCNETYDVAAISKSDYYTKLFLARSEAAYMAVIASESDRELWNKESDISAKSVRRLIRRAFGAE